MLAPSAALLAENTLVHLVGDLFHPLFVVVATALAAIYALIPSFGVAIILLTLVVMAVLTPLTVKSVRSMVAMQRLQPEIVRLRQKYKGSDNRERLNEELMHLYKEQGINPAGSCLPVFLQLPFLIVLYDVIKGLTATVTTSVHGHLVTLVQPRYIPTSSRMFHDLVAGHGAMHWFGINLAGGPFSAHTQWFGVLPYLGLIVVAVVLQYVQVALASKSYSQPRQPSRCRGCSGCSPSSSPTSTSSFPLRSSST